MMIEADTLALARHPPRLLHPRRRRLRRASMRASTAASARATTPPTSPRIAPAWRRRSASRRDGLLTAYQIHSPNVVVAEAPWTLDDAAARRRHRHPHAADSPIGVTTADCGPILFADPQARVIGAAHAGWRGALTGVPKRRSRRWSGSAPTREPHPRRARPDDPASPITRSAPISSRGSRPRTPASEPLLRSPPRGRARPVRSRRLYRGALDAGRRRADRGSRALHLRGSGAIFQLPPLHPSRRSRLRPPRQRDRARQDE